MGEESLREIEGVSGKSQGVEEGGLDMDFQEKDKMEEIADMLEHGANLGVMGDGRWPPADKNNDNVYTHGDRVADALQTGVKDGILYGP